MNVLRRVRRVRSLTGSVVCSTLEPSLDRSVCAHLLVHDPLSPTPSSMSIPPADPQPMPTTTLTPTPDLSASAERLLTTVATAAELAVVRAGTDLEARLARGLTSLNDRLKAALARPGMPGSK